MHYSWLSVLISYVITWCNCSFSCTSSIFTRSWDIFLARFQWVLNSNYFSGSSVTICHLLIRDHILSSLRWKKKDGLAVKVLAWDLVGFPFGLNHYKIKESHKYLCKTLLWYPEVSSALFWRLGNRDIEWCPWSRKAEAVLGIRPRSSESQIYTFTIRAQA